MRSALQEAATFLRHHVWHIFLLPPAIVVVTTVHEAAHAAVVLAYGGTVIEFSVLPGNGEWGHVQYKLPADQPGSHLIALAPYFTWVVVALLPTAIALFRQQCTFWAASMLFVWLFVVPITDIGNAVLPYLAGADNDLSSVFNGPGMIHAVAALAVLAFVVPWGFLVQRRLYGDKSVSFSAYGVLVVVTLCGLTGLVFAVRL
jgi:hypothetical protein